MLKAAQGGGKKSKQARKLLLMKLKPKAENKRQVPSKSRFILQVAVDKTFVIPFVASLRNRVMLIPALPACTSHSVTGIQAAEFVYTFSCKWTVRKVLDVIARKVSMSGEAREVSGA